MVDNIWIERTRHQRNVFALQNPDYGLTDTVSLHSTNIYASKIIKEMVRNMYSFTVILNVKWLIVNYSHVF